MESRHYKQCSSNQLSIAKSCSSNNTQLRRVEVGVCDVLGRRKATGRYDRVESEAFLVRAVE